MKQITHLGKYYFPDRGGIETVTQILAESAINEGYIVKVICFGRVLLGDKNQPSVNVSRHFSSIKIKSQPISLGYFFEAIIESFKSDIIHFHAPNLLATLAILIIPKKINLIVHWHGDIVGKGIFRFLVMPLEYLLLARASYILATSKKYADESSFIRFFSKKTKIVPLGIKPIKITDCLEECPKSIKNFISGKRLVFSVGRLIPYKGFPFLIEAAKFFSDDIVIIIAGQGEMLQELSNQIKQSGLEDKVLLVGKISDANLRYLYSVADVFCLPSIDKSEAFGMVLIEAMSYGIPIVATKIKGSGVSWVNAHGVTGLNVIPSDSCELAKACIQILNDPKLKSVFSENALKRFRNNFTAEKCAEKTLALYKKLLIKR